MKKIISAFLALLLFAAPVTIFAEEDIKVSFNSIPLIFDQPPIMDNGRVLVPMRAIFEAFGAIVVWNDDTQTAFASREYYYDTIEITIGSDVAFVNDVRYSLDVPAQIINGRTLVPVRFVSESLNASVLWIDETQTVEIFGAPINGFGVSFWDNGNVMYSGEFANGRFNGQGMILGKENNKLTYEGTFVNGDIIRGTYYEYNGDGSLYGKYVGEFKNIKFDGQGTVYDGNNNLLYSGTFKDGEYINGKEFNTATYESELAELNEWLVQEQEELLDFINTSPFETKTGKSIMASYQKMVDDAGYTAIINSDGNIDSYSRANAVRQSEAILSEGRMIAIEAHNTQIESMRKAIDATYNSKLQLLKNKWGIK